MARDDKIDEAQKQNTLQNRDEDRNSVRWKQSSWTGLLHPHLLLGENGAQTGRVSVLTGNHQLIGITQTKCVRLRHGSRTIHGTEVIFTDPFKGIHGDENNVCL